MYLDFKVKIPSDSAGITRKKIKGITYVYYAYERNYSPEKGYTVPQSTSIGKCADDDAEMMYPNTNFLKFFPAEELSETKGEAYRSGCLRVGTYLVLRRIISEYYLDEMLGDIDFVEYGHPKEDISAPVINYSVAYDRNNAKPLYYEDYPGSIVNISQLQYTLEKADGYGYKNIGFILDRGYFSKENIHYMDKCGYGYTERDPESI